MPTCGQEELANEGDAGGGDVDSTAVLLDAMEDRYEAFRKMRPAQKRKHWDAVAAVTGLTAEACRSTWNKLLYSFKRMKDNASGKKTGRGSVPTWPYFDRMSRMLSGNPAVTPAHVLTSMLDCHNGTSSVESSAPPAPSAALNDSNTPRPGRSASPPAPSQPDLDLRPASSAPPPPSTPTPLPLPTLAPPSTPSSRREVSTPVSVPQATKRTPSYMSEYLRRREEREAELHAHRLDWGERKVRVEEQRVEALKELAAAMRGRRGGD